MTEQNNPLTIIPSEIKHSILNSFAQESEQSDEFERDEQGREMIVTGTDAIIHELETGVLPIHLQKLRDLEISDEDKEAVLSAYVGVTPRSFKQMANKEIEVQGIMLNWHAPYKGKDGLLHDGYYYTLILTTMPDEDGNPVVIRSSSAGLMQHLIAAMQMRGWYIWKNPVRYRLTVGDDGSHHMKNIEKSSLIKVSGKK